MDGPDERLPGFGRGYDIIDPSTSPPTIQRDLSFYRHRFLPSRRGYPATAANNHMLEINNLIPTRFARPFRSSSGKYLVPTTALYEYGVGVDDLEINSTLLRQDPEVRTDGLQDRPLFSNDWGVTDPTYAFTKQRSMSPGVLDPAGADQQEWDLYYDRFGERPNDHDRNPFFRYQALQRLGNLTTTRSNVYAVWITVGNFEVHRRELLPQEIAAGITSVDRNVYLEGYTLGRELGGDTGEVKRHRAFYVIDRLRYPSASNAARTSTPRKPSCSRGLSSRGEKHRHTRPCRRRAKGAPRAQLVHRHHPQPRQGHGGTDQQGLKDAIARGHIPAPCRSIRVFGGPI